jgi:hypothetical protein
LLHGYRIGGIAAGEKYSENQIIYKQNPFIVSNQVGKRMMEAACSWCN